MNYLQLHEKLGKQQVKFMKGQLEVEIDGVRKPLELKFKYNYPYFKIKDDSKVEDLEVLERLFELLSKNNGNICLNLSCTDCSFCLIDCPRVILKDYYMECMK